MAANSLNEITERIIGAAIQVHRALGPGLLESAYKEVGLDCGYRLDFLVEQSVIVELKSVDQLLPIYEAQLLSYLKLADKRLGLLINFNTRYLKQGIRRIANDLQETPPSTG